MSKQSGNKVVKLNQPENIDPGMIINALGAAVIVVGDNSQILFANSSAEQFFSKSKLVLQGVSLERFLPNDSPVFQLIEQVQGGMHEVTEHGIVLDAPSTGNRMVSVQAAPLVEIMGAVVLNFQERSIADKIDHRLTHRDTARSVSAMAAMMAHEVKNPLSGIRGAAQLLEQNAEEQDRELTRLIQDESDRIRELVERMEVLSDNVLLQVGPVNIHQVLGRVRSIAEHGFASKVRFIEEYDPSLPPVSGDRNQLIQVFLNLVKNAAEAVPASGGEILLKTQYQHGVRFAMPGSESRIHLPLSISVCDNGPGIPQDVQDHLFEPFVTAKQGGSGLGLALVSKIIDDHSGVIDFKSDPGKTMFRVLLPVSDQPLPVNEENEAD
ncbi:MAG: PAS domain-containing protein [Rhodospirillaceae bacterium]|nr:PAS domain-containing protein [Rhodospirillaceae bacterium]